MKPRIAIPIPTTTDIPYNGRSWPTYAAAIERSGGVPVQIDIMQTPAQILELARTCHGICLPGSPADVTTTRYTTDHNPASSDPDPAREAADTLLLEDAAKHAKPVLAICFGTQFLNVWRGGSLVQDLTPLPVNHSAGSKVAIAHTALIAHDSLLAGLLTPDEAPIDPSPETNPLGFLRLPINTSHHQSVSSPGDGLRIVARCPDDGVVEAIENDPHYISTHLDAPNPHQFLLGVQWHPERSYDISPASRALFDRLIQEATRQITL